MATLDFTPEARDFVMRAQAKHARQILIKIIDLGTSPNPPDSKQLVGYPSLRRVDSGEYRIIYRQQGDRLEILLIGKRNDDEVYRQLQRLPFL